MRTPPSRRNLSWKIASEHAGPLLCAGTTVFTPKAAGSFDFILSTVSGDLPWDLYLAALRPQGKLCLVGLPEKPVSFSAFSLMTSEKVIASGIPGSPIETARMLEFTARHGIAPRIEVFPMADANRALEHTRQGRARFRAVLAT